MADVKRHIEKEIQAELEAIIKNGHKDLKPGEVKGVGRRVIAFMIERINVGLSPIRGAGRFPAYKAAMLLNDAKKAARRLKGADKKNFLANQKRSLGRGYPYSVQKEFPNKQVRPVNLRLSGKFLRSLVADEQITPQALRLQIGFDDAESIEKETGHREGAGGQPQRPIIPQGSERFTPEIEGFMFDSFSDLLLRVFSRVKGRS